MGLVFERHFFRFWKGNCHWFRLEHLQFSHAACTKRFRRDKRPTVNGWNWKQMAIFALILISSCIGMGILSWSGAATKLRSYHNDSYYYEILGKVSDIQSQATRGNRAVNNSSVVAVPNYFDRRKGIATKSTFFCFWLLFQAVTFVALLKKISRWWHTREEFTPSVL